MNKTALIRTAFTGLLVPALALAAGCGREITAEAFQFGGVGSPEALPPEPPPAGTAFSLMRIRTPMSSVSLGANDLFIGGGIVNVVDLAGLSGPIFTVEPPFPGKPNGTCYEALGANALLDGRLETVDVGRVVRIQNTAIQLDRGPDADYNPTAPGATDFVSYFAGIEGTQMTYGTDVGLWWDGGTPQMAEFGFETGQSFFSSSNLLSFPQEPLAPNEDTMVLVNGQPMDADTDDDGQPDPLPLSKDGYTFEWRTSGAEADRVAVGIQFYGSLAQADQFGQTTVSETPFVASAGQMICTTKDDGEYTITKERLDEFIERYFNSPAIDGLALEDANGDGELSPEEDLNGNGEIDPLVGAAIIFYRYNDERFRYDLSAEGEQLDGLLKGIAMDYTRLDWRWGQQFANE